MLQNGIIELKIQMKIQMKCDNWTQHSKGQMNFQDGNNNCNQQLARALNKSQKL